MKQNLQENIDRIHQLIKYFMKGRGLSAPEYIGDDMPQHVKDSEEKRFTCQGCGSKEKEYNMYMVNDDLWEKYGNDRNTYCMSCFEDIVGRKLTKDDFMQYKNIPVNLYNPEVQKLFQDEKDI